MSEKQKRTNRKKAERKFNVSDPVFCAQSRVKHKLFSDRLADFNAFDADFDINYANNWFAKIEFCESITNDETTVDEMRIIKGDLDQKVIELIAKVNEVEFYALKAFKDDTEVLHEFQFNKVNRTEQYSFNFIAGVFTIYSFAGNEYNAELTSAGMPPTLLTELRALGEAVIRLEFDHEKFKRIRIRRTRLRIKDMNQLFDYRDAVRKAAQIIYADKPEISGMFD
jgi:hypothetical protein